MQNQSIKLSENNIVSAQNQSLSISLEYVSEQRDTRCVQISSLRKILTTAVRTVRLEVHGRGHTLIFYSG